MQSDLLQAYVGAYEAGKLIGAYLSETLESRYLRLGSQFLDGLQSLLFAVAIARDVVLSLLAALLQLLVFSLYHLLLLYLRSLVPDTEERCLQYIHVAFLYQFGEELQEERDGKQAYVHSIDIGIGGHDDLIVAQILQSVLYIERRLQQVELLILIYHLLRQAVRVKRFAPEGEHSLRVHIAALGDRTAGRVALGNENAGLFLSVVLGI